MNYEKLKIRLEQQEDFREVEELTREAFWNVYRPGCDEHYLVHSMRNCEAFIPQLDFVMEYDNKLIGNIMYTKAVIQKDDGTQCNVISFGPVSVLPEYQNNGIGKRLIEHSIKAAEEIGYGGILIYGDPEYYKKFGFVKGEKFGIATAENMYADPLQAREIIEGFLEDAQGRFQEDGIYAVDESMAENFDQNFEPKEFQENTKSQLRFQELVSLQRPRV